MTVSGKDGWLFFKTELRHLGAGPFWGPAAEKASAASRPEWQDPLPAILDFKEQLDKLGIELVLVPVPPKAVVYPEKLSDAVSAEEGQPPPRLDVNHQEFYRLLGGKGVKVVDLVPEFTARREDAKGPVYCKTDTHWSGLGCLIAAQLVAKELQDRPWLKDVKKVGLASHEKTVSIRGDLLAGLKADPAPEAEKLTLRFVGTGAGTAIEPVEPDAASPVLLVADSHGLVFHVGQDLHAKGAGFADQLALELGFPVDLLASRGDGAMKVRVDLYRRANEAPHWLAGKKVLVWCFSAREFTECTNGWRKLPVKKKTE
jgi:alginate O-acetyltransferase complex protein AlgJ